MADKMTSKKDFFIINEPCRASIACLYRKPEVSSSPLEVAAARSDAQDVSSNIDKQDESDCSIMARDTV
jgi:hypothetical protein